MLIKNSNNVRDVYLNNNEIERIYLNNNIVFETYYLKTEEMETIVTELGEKIIIEEARSLAK